MFMLCYITFMFHNILCYAILHVMFVINMLCLLCFITCYVILYNMLCYITCYVYVMFYKHVILC